MAKKTFRWLKSGKKALPELWQNIDGSILEFMVPTSVRKRRGRCSSNDSSADSSPNPFVFKLFQVSLSQWMALQQGNESNECNAP